MNRLMHLLILAVGVMGTSPPHPCQCWPDWQPVKDGDQWYCKNGDRSFSCNIDIPPLCICMEKGKPVELPLGETNCIHLDQYRFDNTRCEITPELEKWFGKYPQYRLYD
ncbi:uncharacterized protein LOC143199638 [Rhynchophorus ferrugineus]|uniref:uncharacterized protein LOC143199638 n=1 Tax=Rhynchophorus ferrugineus TaxID=354439 RepID=UPI003FCD9479